MKTVSVHMLAFDEHNNVVRPVDVPESRLTGKLVDILDAVYYFGQNEFQPKRLYCSVSAGDVIEWEGSHYMVCRPGGFRKLTPEELESYKAEPRRDRQFHDLVCNSTI